MKTFNAESSRLNCFMASPRPAAELERSTVVMINLNKRYYTINRLVYLLLMTLYWERICMCNRL